jgi:hypothetical protein
LKAERTDAGIVAEVILDRRDEYESMLAELADAGKLGWSSGSAPHAVRKGADGEITRWPLIEGSLTPTPAEPRASAVPLKALAGEPQKEARGSGEELKTRLTHTLRMQNLATRFEMATP